MESGSGCTISSERLPNCKIAGKAARDASAAGIVATGVLRLISLDSAVRRAAYAGIFLAWAATLLGTLLLAFGLRSSWKRFWAAFGAGFFVRMLVLAGLAGYVGMHPEVPAGSLLSSYALGITVLLLIEYRHLLRG